MTRYLPALLVLVLLNPMSVLAVDIDLRQLPSLKVVWTVPGELTELLVEGSEVYTLNEDSVSAYEAGSGRLLWQAPIASEDCCSMHMLIAGKSVVVAAEHELYLFECTTGERTATVTFERRITGLIGPALVVELSDSMSAVELVGIDPETGSERGHWRRSGWLATTYQLEGTLVAMLRDGSDTYEAIGIDAESLTELWRLFPARYSDLHLLGDQILLSQPIKDHTERFQTIDPRSGELGALPQRYQSDIRYSDELKQLQTIDIDDRKSTFTLRRNDPEKSQPVWLVELPGAGIDAHAQVGDQLFLCIHRHPGRGLVTFLDWATGEVQATAYGFRYVQQLIAFEGLLIAACEEGAVAFSSRELGPPEAGLRPVSEDVRRVLASVEGKGLWQVGDAVAELMTLGGEAVPHLVEALPGVDCAGLIASAMVLANARLCDAAPQLAAHLEDMPCDDSRMSSEAFDVVLAALAELGGDGQVVAIARVLHDPDRAGDNRLQALAAMASIGSATAVEIIGELLQPDAAPSRSWWSPPDASAIRDIAGQEADQDALDMAIANDDWQEYARLSKAESSIRVPTGSGSDLLIFPHSIFGGYADLWAAEVDREGEVGEAFFLGASANTDSIVGGDIRIRAKVEGNTATIWRVGQPENPIRVSLAEARRDSDQDGLTDLVELRLRTDPSRRDSDGDGLEDAYDPAPNADSDRQMSEEEEIELAIFRQIHMFRPSTSELAIVVSDSGLEWRGRSGPTVTLDAEDDKRFLEEAGYDGVPHIRISPGFDSMLEEMEKPILAPDERAFTVTSYRGGLNAIGYQVIVRMLANHWVISKIEVTWIS